MFGNQSGSWNQNNNQARDAINVNTKVRTFYSDISCLQLTYWNENLSIRISPVNGVGTDGVRQYNYNMRAATAITVDKAIALKKKIDEVIMPALDEVKKTNTLANPVNVGMSVGNKGSALFIELRNNAEGVPTVSLVLYTNIDAESNKAPADGVYSYPFAKTTMITGYDAETGAATTDTVESEFEFFVSKLDVMSKISTNVAHSVNLENAYKAVAKANYQARNGQGGFNNANNGNDSGYSAPMSNVGSDDFGFLS